MRFIALARDRRRRSPKLRATVYPARWSLTIYLSSVQGGRREHFRQFSRRKGTEEGRSDANRSVERDPFVRKAHGEDLAHDLLLKGLGRDEDGEGVLRLQALRCPHRRMLQLPPLLVGLPIEAGPDMAPA